MLATAKVAGRIPVKDLRRARAWYAAKLGLEPAEERPGGLLYRFADGSSFALFESSGAASGDHTQMGFDVEDIAAVQRLLRDGDVEYEGIAEVEGNYPSKGGRGERALWFRDLDGNLFGVGQAM